MESLRAFAKVGFKLINNQNEKFSTLNGNSFSNFNDIDDLDFDLSSSLEIDINDDAKLFHALNRFITLINNRNKHFNLKIQDIVEDELQKTDPQIISDKIFENTNFSNTYIAQFIRHNLIKYLRNEQLYSDNETLSEELRDVLGHWWSYILDLLTRDKKQQKNTNKRSSIITFKSTDSTNYKENINPYFTKSFISIELVSVCLESISRIMSRLIILNHDNDKIHLPAFSNNILKTIQIVTAQLVENSRLIKDLTNKIGKDHHTQIAFCNNYNSLIRSFLGKLLAFAFIYIPDNLQFDVQLIEALQPNFKINTATESTLVPWKKRNFVTSKIKKQEEKFDSTITNSDTKKVFRVIISYIRHDLCFVSFYWHYWFIIFKMLSCNSITLEKETITGTCPGCNIFIEHSINYFMRNDLYKTNKYLKSIRKQNLNPSINDSMPNSDIVTDDELPTSNSRTNNVQNLDSFVEDSFKSLKIWNCLRLIYMKFPTESKSLNILLNVHDEAQLNYIKTIPAYDVQIANVVYNKILKKIIDLFPDVTFLRWSIWIDGYMNLLKTHNMNNQIIAILSLFNTWEFIPNAEQIRITQAIIGDNDIWENLTLDTAENLVHVLFSKLLIFKMSKLNDPQTKQLILNKLSLFYFQFNLLIEYLTDTELKDKIERECSLSYGGDSVLIFHINKKFILGKLRNSSSTPAKNGRLLYDKKNWILGPLDVNCRKEYKDLLEPPEFTKLRFLISNNDSRMGFRIMLFPNVGKTIEYWNSKWLNNGNTRKPAEEKTLPFKPLEPFNTSLFGDITEISDDIEIKSNIASRKTQYEKLYKFIRLFNLTMIEYYDFQNFENDENIYIDFELFK
ncbi:similar to Saccharomyces cerevisiae YDL073W Putative protein of unknown function [Maudiozyma saulgeensis]|uniref:Uncharacterized protein n=1 Tax=Maudiozyma saulgeensis TaxID=1789683 RepID=A0A1X7QZ36_9SACH|nr:similar to Saccharomyces cerevisiae YDL073W Putative protein of unknown function [Kazachstania saulgeensis]